MKNSGDIAIREEDFQRSFRINFPNGKVISAAIASQYPQNLEPMIETSSSRVGLLPLLLNSNDQIIIQVILSSGNPDSFIDARIIDVPVLTAADMRTPLPPIHQSEIGVIILLLLAFTLYTFYSGTTPNQENILFIFSGTIATILYLVSRMVRRIGYNPKRLISEN